jgi:hypothetical protein
MRVRYVPSISEVRARWAAGEPSGPVHFMVAGADALHPLGVNIVDVGRADLVHAHGVTLIKSDVYTVHGTWQTDMFPDHPSFWDQQNATIAQAMASTRVVVAKSQFVASAARKLHDCQIRVIPQAWDDRAPVEVRQWRELYSQRHIVVWPKTGASPWCDPRPALYLAQQRPDCAMLLMAPESAVRAFAGELPANVFCLGPQPPPVFRGLLRECDVVLQTSPESSGQVHLEALSVGVPLLGYDWGGLPESVNVDCSVLVPPNDNDALVLGFDQLISGQSVMRSAARKCAWAYTWDKIAPLYVALYKELL